MTSTTQLNLFPHQRDDVFYVESSLPAGVTLNEYRRNRPRRTRWARLKQLAGGAQVVPARPA